MSDTIYYLIGLMIIAAFASLFYLGWQVLMRLRKQLQIAHVSLLQQEMKEMTLLQRLHDVNERYRKLEDKLREAQGELRRRQEQA
ncbi:hypothetical protein [Chitinophaga vietnamensis]|uniref:hypothetical protein n=1 Tax=Chitinophaga vietnamensis TaxID=2593957 RepID=UPI001177DD17|nr:hypothetical protein [Chitinophaga vietnamensis]